MILSVDKPRCPRPSYFRDRRKLNVSLEFVHRFDATEAPLRALSNAWRERPTAERRTRLAIGRFLAAVRLASRVKRTAR